MAEQSWIVWPFVFLLGASIGSFLNVVIYRWPRGESLVFPPSHCLSCGARLTWADLIPVFSYLLLRGRCRYCAKPITVRYLLVEAAAGLLSIASVYLFGWTACAAGVFIAASALLVIFFVDLDHMIIPDEATVTLILVGLAFDGYRLIHLGSKEAIVFAERVGTHPYAVYLPRSLVGLAMAGGLFLLIAWVSRAIFRKPAMGMGDVKLAAAMGALLGPGYLFLSYFILSVLLGAGIAVVLIILRLKRRGDYVPFGPMMAAAGVIMLLGGEWIAPWILGWYTP